MRIPVNTAAEPAEPSYVDRIVVRERGRLLLVKVREIDWISSEGNYVLVHAGKAVHTVRETICAIEAVLDPARFRRVHRSTIVNIERVRELRPRQNGSYRVVLDNGVEVTASRTFRHMLWSLLV